MSTPPPTSILTGRSVDDSESKAWICHYPTFSGGYLFDSMRGVAEGTGRRQGKRQELPSRRSAKPYRAPRCPCNDQSRTRGRQRGSVAASAEHAACSVVREGRLRTPSQRREDDGKANCFKSTEHCLRGSGRCSHTLFEGRVRRRLDGVVHLGG